MNTFQLSCFLAVAETLSFARAAEQLHVTQPAVTQQIHSLEKELGATLFHRTTRIVRITGEGLAFLDDARRMVDIAVRAKKRFEHPGQDAIRTLSVGCHGYAQLFLLSQLIRRLAQQYPDLHPNLRTVPFPHLHRMLEEGEVDLVLAFRQSENPKGTQCVYRELCRVPMVCICAADHPLAAKKSLAPEELDPYRLVLLDPARARLEAAQMQGQLIGDRGPAQLYFCESAEAAAVLVEAGYGVSVLPDLFIPPAAALARIPLEGAETASFGGYYKQKALQSNPALKSLVHMLQSEHWPKEQIRREEARLETPQTSCPGSGGMV